jgi:monofunctional chorismate mutase
MMSNQLTAARDEINAIDQQLIQLLERRFKAVVKVNAYKRSHQLPVLDSKRESQVLARVAESVGDQQLTSYLQAIFTEIMHQSRKKQEQQRKEEGK